MERLRRAWSGLRSNRRDSDNDDSDGAPSEAVASLATDLPYSRALCLGDEARTSVFLATLGHDVTSVNQTAQGKQDAESLADDHGVELKTVEADPIEFELGQNRWDLIVSNVHTQPKLRRHIHSVVYDALTPGGILIFDNELSVTLEDLRRELGGLSILNEDQLTNRTTTEVIAEKPNDISGDDGNDPSVSDLGD